MAIRSRLLFLIGAGLIGGCAEELFKLNMRSSKLGPAFLPPALALLLSFSSTLATLGILGNVTEEGVGWKSSFLFFESSRSFCASSLILSFSVESSLSRISVSLYGFDSLFFSFLSFSFCFSFSFSFLLRSSLCLSFSLSLLCLCLSLSFLSPFSSPFRLSSLFLCAPASPFPSLLPSLLPSSNHSPPSSPQPPPSSGSQRAPWQAPATTSPALVQPRQGSRHSSIKEL